MTLQYISLGFIGWSGLGRFSTTLIGLTLEFRSEKILRNRTGTVYVIPSKTVLIPRHSEVYGRVKSWERNRITRKNKFYKKIPAPANGIESVF
jgi:hypothetical protein